jgi:hypothetical protein
MDALKREFFQYDPDEPVIFHRKEMINHRYPFHALRDKKVEKLFNQSLLDALNTWQFHAITIVLDKKAHCEQYVVWRHHPYHYCMEVLLERFVLFLHYGNQHGDVMVESRGRKEDEKLEESYRRLYKNGTDYIPAERWEERLTSGQLKVKPKSANVAGLQLADLIAHPSRREILIENKLISDDRDTFGDKITSILLETKYVRSRNGEINRYGKKLLP